MKREFLQTKPPFTHGIIYKDEGQSNWKRIEEMPLSEQLEIIEKLNMDCVGRRKVVYARINGATNPLQVLLKVIPQVWGKLTPELDIDNNKLNFE